MDDVALLTRIAGGDMDALEALCQRYDTKLYWYLMTLVNDEEAARDLAQETMITVSRSAGSFRGTSKVSSWLFGIARHKALDELRRRGREAQHIEQEPDWKSIEDPTSHGDPERTFERAERIALVRLCLQALSRDHREALENIMSGDFTYGELAELVGCPENTIKTRVYYAKRQMKQCLEQHGLQLEGI